jgi:hypothetical protein
VDWSPGPPSPLRCGLHVLDVVKILLLLAAICFGVTVAIWAPVLSKYGTTWGWGEACIGNYLMHLKILDFFDVLPIVPLGVKLGARMMGKVLELPILKIACEQSRTETGLPGIWGG